MKNAFTMIELIFVIVILGILAAVAIPKLTGTRDDAKIVAQLSGLRSAVSDLGAEYTGSGQMFPARFSNLDCFIMTDNGDGNLSVEHNNTGTYICDELLKRATVSGLIGDHIFGGSRIVW